MPPKRRGVLLSKLKESGDGSLKSVPATMKSPRPMLTVRVAEDDQYRNEPEAVIDDRINR